MDVRDYQLLRLREVLELVGISRSKLYAMVAAGEFPGPVLVGRRAVAWRARDVIAWIEARPTVRLAGPGNGDQ